MKRSFWIKHRRLYRPCLVAILISMPIWFPVVYPWFYRKDIFIKPVADFRDTVKELLTMFKEGVK